MDIGVEFDKRDAKLRKGRADDDAGGDSSYPINSFFGAHDDEAAELTAGIDATLSVLFSLGKRLPMDWLSIEAMWNSMKSSEKQQLGVSNCDDRASDAGTAVTASSFNYEFMASDYKAADTSAVYVPAALLFPLQYIRKSFESTPTGAGSATFSPFSTESSVRSEADSADVTGGASKAAAVASPAGEAKPSVAAPRNVTGQQNVTSADVDLL